MYSRTLTFGKLRWGWRTEGRVASRISLEHHESDSAFGLSQADWRVLRRAHEWRDPESVARMAANQSPGVRQGPVSSGLPGIECHEK